MDFITVSPHPTGKKKILFESLSEFDVVVNVSDHIDFTLNEWLCKNSIQLYWFPLGEAFPMALENIFGAMSVLWNAEQNNKKVLLHCVAGRNRSRMIKDCYQFMVTGQYEEKSSMMLNIKDNQLPGIYRTELFLQKCLEVLKTPELAEEAFIDWIRKETFCF